jgi:hypothetical protein
MKCHFAAENFYRVLWKWCFGHANSWTIGTCDNFRRSVAIIPARLAGEASGDRRSKRVACSNNQWHRSPIAGLRHQMLSFVVHFLVAAQQLYVTPAKPHGHARLQSINTT